MTSVHRRLEHKVYLKLRLSCVLVDEDDERNEAEVKEESESEVDEDMWETMAVVADRKGRGKKKKRRIE